MHTSAGPRAKPVAICLLLTWLLVGGVCRGDEPSRVAVVGIAAETPPSVDNPDPAAGLADLLEAALQARGATLVERRSLGPVLAERRLQRWLADTGPGRLAPLPGVEGLIVGRLSRNEASGALRVEARILRANDGVRLALAHVEARHTDELPDAIERLAESLLPHLRLAPARSSPPRRLPGFSDQPEAVLMYYRALDHLAQGRPAWAIAYFAEARIRDRDFHLAREWQARVMERVGLGDFAAELRAAYDGAGADELAKLLAIGRAGSERAVWVIAAPDVAPADARRVEAAVAAHPDAALLDASHLRRIVTESDLKLSGEFEELPTATDRWLFADALLLVEANRITLKDAVTGGTLAEADGWLADPAGAVAAALEGSPAATVERVARAEPALPAERASVHPVGTRLYEAARLRAENGVSIESFSPSRVHRAANLLQRLLDEPNSVSVLYAVGELWEVGYTPAAHRRIVRLIERDRSLPDAAAWLNTTLFRADSFSFGRNWLEAIPLRLERELPQAERYAPLLRWFPESAEARLVAYARAHEAIAAGRTEEAVTLLEETVETLDAIADGRLALVQELKPDGTEFTNAWFFLARERFRLGRLAAAAEALERCQRELETYGRRVYPLYEFGVHCAADEVAFHFCSRFVHSHRQYITHRNADFTDIRPQVAALARRVGEALTGEGAPRPYRGSRERMLAAIAGPIDEAFEHHWASVEQFILERPDNMKAPDHVLQQLAWLRVRCNGAEQLRRWHGLVDRLLAGQSRWSDRVYDLNLLAGRFDEAQAVLDQRRRSKSLRTWSDALLRQLELDSFRCNDSDQLDRLRANLRQLEATFAAEVEAGHIDYYRLVEHAAPALIALGDADAAAARLRRIGDDPRVPAFYRARAGLRLGEALALTADLPGATQMLRWVDEVAGDRGGHEVKWDVPEDQRNALYSYRALSPKDAADLAYEARYHLRRLRVYGGQPVVDRLATPPEWRAPVELDAEDLAELPAFVLPMSLDSEYNDYKGVSHWINEAWRELADRGVEAGPTLRRMLSIKRFKQDAGVDAEVGWHAVLALNPLPPNQQPSRELMLRWLVWSPVCEVKKHAVYSLLKSGPDDGRVLPILALSTGMTGGCQEDAVRVLRQIGPPHDEALPHLHGMLTHPVAAVRRHAALVLAGRVGVKLPLGDASLPTDEAVEALRAYLRDRPVGPPPVSPADGHLGEITHWSARFGVGLLVTADDRGEVLLWSTRDDAPPRRLPLPEGFSSGLVALRLSDDGRRLVVADRTHRLVVVPIDRSTEPIFDIRLPLEPGSASFMGDDALLVAQRHHVLLFDLATGRERRRFLGHRERIDLLLPFDEGRRLITASYGSELWVWDMQTGRRIRELHGHDMGMLQLAATADGRLLTSARDETVRLWDPDTGEELRRFTFLPGSEIGGVTWPSRDGLTSVAEPNGRIHVLDLHSGDRVRTIDTGGRDPYGSVFDVEGMLWQLGRDGVLQRWDPRGGHLLQSRPLRSGPAAEPALERPTTPPTP